MRALVLVVVFAACGVVPRDSVGSRSEVLAPPEAERVVDLLSHFYLAKVGMNVLEAPLEIHWTTDMPKGYLGQTWHTMSEGCSTWVVADALFAYPRLLPHELAHCARWMLTGDGDATHVDVFWWGQGGLVDQALATIAANTERR